MTALPKKKIYTPEEYLALEDNCEYRSEYVDGYIYQMAGSTESHNEIFFKCRNTIESKITRKV